MWKLISKEYSHQIFFEVKAPSLRKWLVGLFSTLCVSPMHSGCWSQFEGFDILHIGKILINIGLVHHKSFNFPSRQSRKLSLVSDWGFSPLCVSLLHSGTMP